MKPIIKPRTYVLVIEQIMKKIEAGQLSPGSRIPSERELSIKLSVGRSSIREAITVLESYGVLEVKQGVGVYVKETESRNPIKKYFRIFSMLWRAEPSEIVQLLQVREMLEPQAARLAAKNAKERDIEELGLILEKMKSMKEFREDLGDESDFHFHYLIARSAGNNALLIVIDTLAELIRKGLRQTRWIAIENPERMKQVIHEHGLIYKAIRERNGLSAEVSMKKHLKEVKNNFTNFLKEE